MQTFTYDNNDDIKKYAEENNIPKELFEHTYFNCNYYETRNSWGHKGYITKDGIVIDNSRIRYYNRTWERYTYQSLLFHMLDKYKKYLKKNKMI